jgi:hypothetical protein
LKLLVIEGSQRPRMPLEKFDKDPSKFRVLCRRCDANRPQARQVYIWCIQSLKKKKSFCVKRNREEKTAQTRDSGYLKLQISSFCKIKPRQ